MPDAPDLRPLSAALHAGANPAEVWREIRQLIRDDERWYVARCRYCGDEFWTECEPTGTKWTQMCTSCLQDQT